MAFCMFAIAVKTLQLIRMTIFATMKSFRNYEESIHAEVAAQLTDNSSGFDMDGWMNKFLLAKTAVAIHELRYHRTSN